MEHKLTINQLSINDIPHSMSILEKHSNLIQGLKKGKRSAQQQFYKTFFTKMYPISIRFSGSKEESHEIINTAFMSVLDSIHRYKEGNFEGWVSQIVRRTAVDYYRKYNFNKTNTLELVEYDEVTYNNAITNLQLEEILNLIQMLPAATRTVFNLFIFDDMSHEEISKKLNISIGTSKWHVSNGRSKMTELFNTINQ